MSWLKERAQKLSHTNYQICFEMADQKFTYMIDPGDVENLEYAIKQKVQTFYFKEKYSEPPPPPPPPPPAAAAAAGAAAPLPEEVAYPVYEGCASTLGHNNALMVYVVPPPVDCYIPNENFRELICSVQKSIRAFNDDPKKKIPKSIHKLKLSGLLGKPTSFNKILKIKEDKARRLSTLINEIISARCRSIRISSCSQEDAAIAVGDFPVSGKTHPDFVLCASTASAKTRVLMGVELKRLKKGIAQALPQLCGLLADLNLHHYCNGADLKDCAIPGYVLNNHTVQFFGGYLMKKSVSSFCTLSRPLSFTVHQDMCELSAWMENLPSYLVHVFESVKPATKKKQLKTPMLSLKEHFFKPIRCNDFECGDDGDLKSLAYGNTITRIFRVYHVLHNNEDAREFVEFPVGLMTLTHKNSKIFKNVRAHAETIWDEAKLTDFIQGMPLIVYDKLTGWSNGIPQDRETAALFLRELEKAVQACTAAGVVFFDLRIPNIMWKQLDNGTIQIRLVDFEHVYLSDYAVNSSILADFTPNTRYTNCRKLRSMNGMQFADPKTNGLFFKTITACVQEYFRDNDTTSETVDQTSENSNDSALTGTDGAAEADSEENHTDTGENPSVGDVVEDMHALTI